MLGFLTLRQRESMQSFFTEPLARLTRIAAPKPMLKLERDGPPCPW